LNPKLNIHTDRHRETLINSQKSASGQPGGAANTAAGTGAADAHAAGAGSDYAEGAEPVLATDLEAEGDFGYHNGNGTVEY
jgi:hypothetical protein